MHASLRENLVPPDNANKSEKKILILSKIKYLKLLFKRSQGVPVNEVVLEKICSKLKINTNSNDPHELNTLINQACAEWRSYKEQAHIMREVQLEDMIQDNDKNDEKKKASAIRRIKHIEKTRRMHKRISQTLGSKRGGSLSKIEVPTMHIP